MANVTLEQIKELREKTQVGMMDCKKALIEADGNIEKAIEILRKKGAAVAAKRAGKESLHGRIESFISDNHKTGSLVKLSTETDFSANTDDAKTFAKKIAREIAINKPLDKNNLLSLIVSDKKISIQEYLNELIAKITENIKISEFEIFSVEHGIVNSYIHPGSTLGTLIEIETDKYVEFDKVSGEKIKQLSHDICMQIAVTAPISIDKDQIPHRILEKEREIVREQLLASGKAEQIIEKILKGKMNKYYQEACLLEQPFIKNDKIKIKQYIQNVEKETETNITIKKFKRFVIGK